MAPPPLTPLQKQLQQLTRRYSNTCRMLKRSEARVIELTGEMMHAPPLPPTTVDAEQLARRDGLRRELERERERRSALIEQSYQQHAAVVLLRIQIERFE